MLIIICIANVPHSWVRWRITCVLVENVILNFVHFSVCNFYKNDLLMYVFSCLFCIFLLLSKGSDGKIIEWSRFIIRHCPGYFWSRTDQPGTGLVADASISKETSLLGATPQDLATCTQMHSQSRLDLHTLWTEFRKGTTSGIAWFSLVRNFWAFKTQLDFRK